jgi:O-antigen/teichoic acid export membrane protein
VTTGVALTSTARIQLAASVVRSALLFVFQWLLAWLYGPVIFGVCNTAQTGLQTATMFGRAAGDTIVLREASNDLRLGLTFSIIGGLLAGMGLLAWSAVAARPPGVPDVWAAYALAAAAVPFAAVAFPLGAALQRANRFVAYALSITLLDPVVRLLALVMLAVVGTHWLWSMGAFPVGAGIAAVVALLLVRKAYRGMAPAQRADSGRIRALIMFSGQTTAAAALQSGMLFVALTVTGLGGRGDQAGILAAAARVVMLALWIQLAYATPFLPMIPKLVALQDNGVEAGRVYHSVVTAVLWVNAPFLAGIAAGAEGILALFGAEFRAGAALIVILAVGQWVNSATALAEDFLPLSGRSRLALANNASALLFTTVASLILVTRLGAVGVAIAYTLAIILLNVTRAYQIRRLFQITLPVGFAAKAAVASIIAFFVGTRLTGFPSLVRGAVGAVLVFVVLYAVATTRERGVLRILLSRRGRAPS